MAEPRQDDERTVISGRPLVEPQPAAPPPPPPARKRNPWVWGAVAGCAGLLCLALLGVAAAMLIQRGGELQVSQATGTATAAIVVALTPTETETVEASEPTTEATAAEAIEEPTATEAVPVPAATQTPRASTPEGPTRTPTRETEEPADTPVPQEPNMGSITFASGVTDDNQPVGPSTSFPADVQEIHAIFDYAGMSGDDIWERRWYRNGEEVSSGTGNWDAGENGSFDLSLSGGGEPLGGGDWKLEIYVNGELAQTGGFSIQAAEAAATAEPTAGRPTGGTYRIAFSRWDGGKHNLFIANTDGSGEQFVLERAAGPAWSLDLSHLYVYGTEGVDQQVRDGTPYTWPDAGISNGVLFLDLTVRGAGGLPNAFQDPTWKEGTGRAVALSPNESMLAYDATHGSPDRRIYFLGTSENQQFNIEIPGEHPAWSPNSQQIVYRSGRNGKQGLWISNRDDSGAHNVTVEGNDAFPAWSPDGGKIAFHRESGGNVDIYLMNVDGSNIRRLTDAPGPDTLPAWTPDGSIVFRSARSGAWGMYIMGADGSNQRQIIVNADPGPDWAFGRMDVR